MIDFIKINDTLELDLRDKRRLNLHDLDRWYVTESILTELKTTINSVKRHLFELTSPMAIATGYSKKSPIYFLDEQLLLTISTSTGMNYDLTVENNKIILELIRNKDNQIEYIYSPAVDDSEDMMISPVLDIQREIGNILIFNREDLDTALKDNQNFIEFVNDFIPKLGFTIDHILPGPRIFYKLRDKKNNGSEFVEMSMENEGSGFKKTIEILYLIYNTIDTPKLIIYPDFTTNLHPLLEKALYSILMDRTESKIISTFQY
jgi:hypothetical protein